MICWLIIQDLIAISIFAENGRQIKMQTYSFFLTLLNIIVILIMFLLLYSLFYVLQY